MFIKNTHGTITGNTFNAGPSMTTTTSTTDNPFNRHLRFPITSTPKQERDDGAQKVFDFGSHNTISNNHFNINYHYGNSAGSLENDRKQGGGILSKLRREDKLEEGEQKYGSGEMLG